MVPRFFKKSLLSEITSRTLMCLICKAWDLALKLQWHCTKSSTFCPRYRRSILQTISWQIVEWAQSMLFWGRILGSFHWTSVQIWSVAKAWRPVFLSWLAILHCCILIWALQRAQSERTASECKEQYALVNYLCVTKLWSLWAWMTMTLVQMVASASELH